MKANFNNPIKLILIIIISLMVTTAFAGTILLTGIGKGTPGPAAACSNSLDFSDGCNSQYITVI